MGKELNKDQAAALNLMLEGGNCFLTGEAGTGKTFLTSTFIDLMQQAEKNMIICAPTGAAALRIEEAAKDDRGIDVDAYTIHRAFKLVKKDIFELNGRKPHKERNSLQEIIR